jgi:hypothetical protein
MGGRPRSESGKTFSLLTLLCAAWLAFIWAGPALALGAFSHSTIASVGTQGRALGDLDGDGYADVVLAEGEFNTTFAWCRYPSWTQYAINDSAALDLDYVPDCTLADLDGDGDLDLILPNSNNSGNKELYWFENPRPDGDPTETEFSRHIIWSADTEHIKDVAVADMDQDHKLDIVLRFATSKVMIFFQDSATSWTSLTIAAQAHEGMAVGDLNGDGWPDVVCNGYWLKNPQSRNGAWTNLTIDEKWFNQSGGGYQDNACRVQAADLTGDGQVEPIFSHSEKPGYPVSYYTADDPLNGPWTEHVIGYVDYCHTLAAGDADGDGDLDLLAATLPSADSDQVLVLLNLDGAGTSWDSREVDNKSSYIAKWADLDNDGDLDIVGSRSYNSGPIDLWMNQTNPRRGPILPGLLLNNP